MTPPTPTGWTRHAPLLFVLLWSTGFIGAKLGLPHAPPLGFLAMRYALVVTLMAAAALWVRAPWPQGVRAWGHLAVAGLLVHAVYLGGVFTGISQGLPAGVSSLVVGLQPLLTAVGAGWVLGEAVRPKQWLGLVLGLVGVVLVLSSRLAGAGLDLHTLGQIVHLPGLPAALIALLGITAGTLYQKRFCPRFDWRTGAVAQFLPCLLLTGALAWTTEDRAIDWSSGAFVFALSWLVLVLSLGAVGLLNFLIRSGTAVNVASLFYMVPPCTAVVAWALFGEALSPVAMGGMVIAMAGVYLARK
ncbi:DMT family transporter [Sphaerotilus sp.]|uniref:DMT family transporter n=1 Tax=Sphaerotilus sp. TaxID=2093942 RepID=UPI002ACD3BAC|nr:DMT family transporter [Sphaerotilus sp.]MDZ7856700.1 DMT family transporter [Sphaerotilus sp.]